MKVCTVTLRPTTPYLYAPPTVLIGAAFINRPPQIHAISEKDSLELAMQQEAQLSKIDLVPTQQLLELKASLARGPKLQPPTGLISLPRDGAEVLIDQDGLTKELRGIMERKAGGDDFALQLLESDPNVPKGYSPSDPRFEQLYEAQTALNAQYDDGVMGIMRFAESMQQRDEVYGNDLPSLHQLLLAGPDSLDDQDFATEDEREQAQIDIMMKMEVLKLIEDKQNGIKNVPTQDDLIAMQYLRDRYIELGHMTPDQTFLGLGGDQIDALIKMYEERAKMEKFQKEAEVLPGVYSLGTGMVDEMSEDEFDSWLFDGEGRGNENDPETKERMEKMDQARKIQKEILRAKLRLAKRLYSKLEEKHGPLGPEPDQWRNPGKHIDWVKKKEKMERAVKMTMKRIDARSPLAKEDRRARYLANLHLRHEWLAAMTRVEALELWEAAGSEEERQFLMDQIDEALEIQRYEKRRNVALKRLLQIDMRRLKRAEERRERGRARTARKREWEMERERKKKEQRKQRRKHKRIRAFFKDGLGK